MFSTIIEIVYYNFEYNVIKITLCSWCLVSASFLIFDQYLNLLNYLSDHWKQFRFRQFYLDISNSSVTKTKTFTSRRTRCYTDNTTYPYLPQNKIEIPCIQTARYVIVETTYDAPEDNPTRGAILEICEIEVYGLYMTPYISMLVNLSMY